MPKILAGTALHSDDEPNPRKLRSDSRLQNSQGADMLIDPQDRTSGFTHSDGDLKYKGSKRISAAITDQELSGLPRTHKEGDPSEGYLDTEGDDLPMIDVPPLAAGTDDEFDDLVAAEDDDTDDLFATADDDLADDSDEEFSAAAEDDTDEQLPDMDEEKAEDLAADFEEDEEPLEETLALVDADEVPDDVDGDELTFACTANAVHVIRANRIIASMGPAGARKANVSDIYTSQVFHDAVVANIEQSGLRKGLVQAGLQLSRVKLKAAKVTAKLVQSRVKAATAQHITAAKQQQQALEQSLAIAAVGINTNYFKGTKNPLKAALEQELSHAGVRGAHRLVAAVFAKHGVEYTRSVLTLAQRLAAMSEEARDGYVAALDMVEDEPQLNDALDIEANDDPDEYDDEDELQPLAASTSITAALVTPARRAALLQASPNVGNQARAILAGNQPLI